MKDMKKIIVASDSFKGSLTSIEVANAVEIGIKNVFPQCNAVSYTHLTLPTNSRV
mgnify:CR=1 FL=1